MRARASRRFPYTHTHPPLAHCVWGELISYFVLGGVTGGAKTAVTCDNNPVAAADRFGRARHKIDRKEAHPTVEGARVCIGN